ncbi:AMP-dependent synthetase/ligase [Paraliomyxa miuraensis]|uniref:AMP-dependent synthetase/ligase n=1 Tax=Paraliomyxa miuraensis TaxID=376150 RepID=UPI00225A9439|nr:long-chain fatty acid--CoA ligase [Paraliomyxa miuraensis]MCX4244961.1 AMP-binding protein [Paraliomyxa miuraensis]
MDATPYLEPRPAPRPIFDHLDERGDRPRFFVREGDDWRPITWREHAREIEDVALLCADAGLRPGECAAIFAHNRVEWMSAALGIQAAGGVMVPIYPASTTDQASYIIAHSGAAILFVAGDDLLQRALELWPQAPALRLLVVMDEASPSDAVARLRASDQDTVSADQLARAVITWPELRRRGRALAEAAPDRRFRTLLDAVELSHTAQMLYTSGTTGRPKGVPLTHANIATNWVDWLRCNAPLIEDDAVDLLWLPMSHIFGFGEACAGNYLGFQSYLCDPKSALDLMPTVRPHVFMSVPAYWEKLAGKALAHTEQEAQRQALLQATGGRLRFCLSGGAGLPLPVKQTFHRHGLLIIEGYGLTECSPTLTLNRPDDFRFDSVGKPLPSVQVRLADDGEILAKGPNVFAGYHEDPEATAAAFTHDGWFRTGDLGRFTDDGFLQITGRKKEILVTAGGKNVPPANIELRLAHHPWIAHVVVYGDGKKYLVAGLWLDQPALEAALDERGTEHEHERAEATMALCRAAVDEANAALASFEQIKRFGIMPRPLTVDAGHLTSTLKVRRTRIYEDFRAELEALYA